MVELVEAAAWIDSVKGNTEKYETGAEPEAESSETGCVPGRGHYDVGQLFWISLHAPRGRCRVAQPPTPAKRAAQQKVERVRSEKPALEVKMMA